MTPVRVLVVDDSAYLRKVLTEMLRSDPRLQVVGTARDGLDALSQVDALRPDVVTLDLIMPELDGVGFMRAQMETRRVPVVVVSSAGEEAEEVMHALDLGALEFVQKPTALSTERHYEIRTELIDKVLAAAGEQARQVLTAPPEVDVLPTPYRLSRVAAVVIGISTGGPQALRRILAALPGSFPVPIAIVMHMPVGYTAPFAQKVNERVPLEVVEALEGLEMKPGRAILARAGQHLTLARRDGRVVAHLNRDPRTASHCPSVDVLFRSAAEVYGGGVLGIVMTGMGSDGTDGTAWIKAQGGTIFAEAEESCVVFGMPRSVIEAGLADRVIPLESLAEAMCAAL